MDPSGYKTHTTSRGIAYNYYQAAPREGKPTLLLAHGFPSSSADWTPFVAFFQPIGYGLIVPDMLGYGGTDKPTDPAKYVGSGIAQDLIDLLDAEGAGEAVAIGHDWGSVAVSRLANFHADRFIGFAFLAVGYAPPRPKFDPAATAALMKQVLGYVPSGYWPTFSAEGADKLIEGHIDSFIDLVFAGAKESLLEHLCPLGAVKAFLEEDKRCAVLSQLTEEARDQYKAKLLSDGLAGPVCWYKVQTQGLAAADDQKIPQEAYFIRQPVFFAACLQEAVAPPALGMLSLNTLAKGPLTVKEFDSGHWVIISHATETCEALLEWLQGSIQSGTVAATPAASVTA
ncbi:alpha/beta-hydrolase [Amylostereum chailletii]|nr:alpha/beta-hydrolase [Amylostereum chailletii]